FQACRDANIFPGFEVICQEKLYLWTLHNAKGEDGRRERKCQPKASRWNEALGSTPLRIQFVYYPVWIRIHYVGNSTPVSFSRSRKSPVSCASTGCEARYAALPCFHSKPVSGLHREQRILVFC